MAQAWFFQANPKLYNIDEALRTVDRIWWRTPQYAADVHSGDIAVIWRSGKKAGIVGVGRVITEPQRHEDGPEADPFSLTSAGEPADSTQVLIKVRDAPFIPKDRIRALAGLEAHTIVVAPMGTVFPISEVEWDVLSQVLPTPPINEPAAITNAPLPSAFAWPQRTKSVLPLPGGYSGYLESLKCICEMIEEERPPLSALPDRIGGLFDLTPKGARLRESFLRKIGIISVSGGICDLSDWARQWMTAGDDRIIVALLHSRCQFAGEILAEALNPQSTDELLAVANTRYGMGWDTQTQISNRRGWLQSAGMIRAGEDGRVETTSAGRALLAELDAFDPITVSAQEVVEQAVLAESQDELGSPVAADAAPLVDFVDELAQRLETTSTDSHHPELFERAVRDAFDFLGFDAQWLGGAGRTDVLLDAVLGKEDQYRAIVDCKTTASGAVGDQQIDWVTLAEHRKKHSADHVAVVAPNPSGSRLVSRATEQGVAIISCAQLIGLCRQHAKAPQGLDDYRALFSQGGTASTDAIDEQAEDSKRLAELAATLCQTIRQRSGAFGRLTARDLYLILAGNQLSEGTSEGEIQELLDGLASPLLRILYGSQHEGYRVTSSPSVFGLRLRALSKYMSGPLAGPDK